jgi:hypothetical protein
MQAGALTRKQAAYQKRKWLSNAALLSGPFLICMLLWVLQNVINQQLDSRDFRCGCKCLACCDWVAGDASGNGTDASGSGNGTLVYQCYQATDERPCSPYAKCQSYNDSECGFLYSTADQVGFCPVAEPPLWPALLDVPQEQYRGSKAPDLLPNEIPTRGIPPSDAPMLFTGGDSQAAERLMGAMWARQQPITDAVSGAVGCGPVCLPVTIKLRLLLLLPLLLPSASGLPADVRFWIQRQKAFCVAVCLSHFQCAAHGSHTASQSTSPALPEHTETSQSLYPSKTDSGSGSVQCLPSRQLSSHLQVQTT